MKSAILVLMMSLVWVKAAPGPVANLALNARAIASSTLEARYAPGKAADGVASLESRWVSADGPGPHFLILEWTEAQRIGCIQVVSGWPRDGTWVEAIQSFQMSYWDGNDWKAIPDIAATNNTKAGLSFPLAAPITTEKLRLISTDPGRARVAELRVFEPRAQGYPEVLAESQARPPVPILTMAVNQSGYNLDWPKRMTAPEATEGAEFIITAATAERELYRGQIHQGIGDFSEFRPMNSGIEYVVKMRNSAFAKSPSGTGGGSPGTVSATNGWQKSDPFVIAPLWMERVSLEPALRFMIDARSVVGTHPSAFGGCPWRDATYYSFEIPSLVLLYLANPDFFENARVEMNYEADKSRILSPEFKLVPANHDQGALEAARRYYRELDPPVGPAVPDLVHLLHWGIGYYLMKPASHDPSGDPAGLKIHPQTVEQFAFFLYGYPHYRKYFSDAFYKRAREFAWTQWEPAGLFTVLTNVGDFKGRECPGHSILPNLMMEEVAKHEGRPESARFLKAALDQAQWVVDTLDFRDPRVSKGQRMSEHKLIAGLTALLRLHPEQAPRTLRAWLSGWADVMMARSSNLWDFRRYDETHWTLPRFTAGSHGGAGWNEPGNVAAFPGLCWSVAATLQDQDQVHRLNQIAAAHWDNLFGRNPLGAHAAYRGVRDFKGVERGWPKAFPEDVCARLERARGTINSTCGHEHYPFNPQGEFRHPEGWTAFNAAFNVGLAYTCWRDTRITIWDGNFQRVLENGPAPPLIGISLMAPIGEGNTPAAPAVTVKSSAGDLERFELRSTTSRSLEWRGRIPLSEGLVRAGDGILQIPGGGGLSVAYGFGILERRRELAFSPQP